MQAVHHAAAWHDHTPMIHRSTQHCIVANHRQTYTRVHHLHQDTTASTSLTLRQQHQTVKTARYNNDKCAGVHPTDFPSLVPRCGCFLHGQTSCKGLTPIVYGSSRRFSTSTHRARRAFTPTRERMLQICPSIFAFR